MRPSRLSFAKMTRFIAKADDSKIDLDSSEQIELKKGLLKQYLYRHLNGIGGKRVPVEQVSDEFIGSAFRNIYHRCHKRIEQMLTNAYLHADIDRLFQYESVQHSAGIRDETLAERIAIILDGSSVEQLQEIARRHFSYKLGGYATYLTPRREVQRSLFT